MKKKKKNVGRVRSYRQIYKYTNNQKTDSSRTQTTRSITYEGDESSGTHAGRATKVEDWPTTFPSNCLGVCVAKDVRVSLGGQYKSEDA